MDSVLNELTAVLALPKETEALARSPMRRVVSRIVNGWARDQRALETSRLEVAKVRVRARGAGRVVGAKQYEVAAGDCWWLVVAVCVLPLALCPRVRWVCRVDPCTP